MKNHIFAGAFLLSACVTAIAGEPISASQLPKAARDFISLHFPGDRIRKSEMDRDHGREAEYEVKLASGAEVEFTSSGLWKEVKASMRCAVPSAIVPKGVAHYADSVYPGLQIVEISRKRNLYEIELIDGTEVKLDVDGNPLRRR